MNTQAVPCQPGVLLPWSQELSAGGVKTNFLSFSLLKTSIALNFS